MWKFTILCSHEAEVASMYPRKIFCNIHSVLFTKKREKENEQEVKYKN